jgi:hypothetical protein
MTSLEALVAAALLSTMSLTSVFARRSKKMRLMTITRLFAISIVLLSGMPAFAAADAHHDTRDICREQNTGFCRRSPFNIKIPDAVSDQQAKANAASKTWPGDMILG